MPSKVAFESVCKKLKDEDLTLEMVGDVFGKQFWMLIVLAFLDAQDAARAIQTASRRLSMRDACDAPEKVLEVTDAGS